jgi:hypothetical protein
MIRREYYVYGIILCLVIVTILLFIFKKGSQDAEISNVMIPEMAFTSLQLYRRLVSGKTRPPFYTPLYNDVLYSDKKSLKLVPATVIGYLDFTQKLTLKLDDPTINLVVNTLNLQVLPAINFKTGTRVSVIIGKSTASTNGKYTIVGLYTPAPILQKRTTTGRVTKVISKTTIQVSYTDPWDKRKYSKTFSTPKTFSKNSLVKVTVTNMAPRISTIG